MANEKSVAHSFNDAMYVFRNGKPMEIFPHSNFELEKIME